MGLTNKSSGFSLHALHNQEPDVNSLSGDYRIALAGNPNVGKSTIFNALTGLNQHTGNWPGKTVTSAQGLYRHNGKNVALVDLPGTYSLLANSVEEQIARDFICFGQPNVTVVVTDATCLQRNLNLVLQVLEITPQAIVCLNLIDEAERNHVHIDVPGLAAKLGAPVIPTAARNGAGLDALKDAIDAVASGVITTNPIRVRYSDKVEAEVERLVAELQHNVPKTINTRWLALRLLEGDHSINQYLQANSGITAFMEV